MYFHQKTGVYMSLSAKLYVINQAMLCRNRGDNLLLTQILNILYNYSCIPNIKSESWVNVQYSNLWMPVKIQFCSTVFRNLKFDWLGCFMVFNATFNNISVIIYGWWSVLLVEETGVPGENHQPVANHYQTLSHNVVSIEYTSPWMGFEPHNFNDLTYVLLTDS